MNSKTSLDKQLFNERPKRYDTWLSFYDSISPDLLNEPMLRIKESLTPSQYAVAFGQNTTWCWDIEWVIERDFYLARVAEELLPSRYSRSEVHALSLALHEGHRYTTTGIPDTDAFLKRTWEVASL